MPQHVCVSVPSGTEDDGPPEADETAVTAVYPKPAQCSSHTFGPVVPCPTGCHTTCMPLCLCMCVFPCLCLYIPSVNRVPSSCPWISIDRECGICWVFLSISLCERAGGSFVGYNKVTQWRLPLCRYLWLLWPNVKVWAPILQRHGLGWVLKGFNGRMKALMSTTQHAVLGEKHQMKFIPGKSSKNIKDGI